MPSIIKAIFLLAVASMTAAPAFAATAGHVDDFQSGTTQGWQEGAGQGTPNRMIVFRDDTTASQPCTITQHTNNGIRVVTVLRETLQLRTMCQDQSRVLGHDNRTVDSVKPGWQRHIGVACQHIIDRIGSVLSPIA